jgi:hypothetical protein
MARYRSVRKPGGSKGPPREVQPPSGGGPPSLPEPEHLSGGFEGAPGRNVPRFEAPRGEKYVLREIEESNEASRARGGGNGG